MWIVKVALTRPYTFIVLALLILIAAPIMILRTPTDIFPNINIPVVSVGFTYTGLNPEEVEGRLTTPYEKALTTLVDNIQHVESTSYNGFSVIRVYLQPGASLDTANAQVTAASQYLLRQLPPGILPPQIINFSASSVPILQLGVSGEGLSEASLNDYATNFVRAQLVTVPGSVVPLPFGGKQRQVSISMDQAAMQAKGIAPGDLLAALSQQNVVTPSGTIKIGPTEYDVRPNGTPRTLDDLAGVPIKQVNGTTIFLRDVATVADGFSFQTNVVRQDGKRGVLVSVLKNGNSSTLDVVKGIRKLLPRVQSTLPPQLKLAPLGDQSVFVRAAVEGVIREAIIAAALTAVMILVFLGSWRSTIIIAISIPLSILTSVIILGLIGETINTMTLGGLALAVGILVDDATVTIENIERYLEDGFPLLEAIEQGAAQISVPALVSTLCICIVFLPMFFLSGVSRFLFVPLAEAVVFAMLASYILSRTLVPTLAMYLLKAHDPNSHENGLFARFTRAFNARFEKVRQAYDRLLRRLIAARSLFVPAFLGLCLITAVLIPFLGQDFFPDTDSGQFVLHVRAPTGTRIEETAKLFDQVEDYVRKTIPADEMSGVLDNIGMPYSSMNTQHLTNGTISAGDGDIFVTLKEDHHPTAGYVKTLRTELPRQFPKAKFYMLPADITTQILNFGIPAPIDIQIEGNNIQASKASADTMLAQLRSVPGLVDLRIQQNFDGPVLEVNVDRTKALQGGFNSRDVTQSLLNTLSGSFQVTPMFFLNWKNGVNYNMVAQTPQYKMDSMQDLQNIPINRNTAGAAAAAPQQPEILGDIAKVQRGHEITVINHYNIRRVVDIYGSVQGRDLGAVSRDIQKIIDTNQKSAPRGTFITLKGQVETMKASYIGLIGGLAFAIVLVYLLIVVNFQSWVDPFIIITALPAALAGIILFLFLTGTRLSVPALMGAIMCMGVATANSILVVSFAKQQYEEHGDALRAAIEAGATRFRPVLMTAIAMIIGMVPMALGAGDGGEQNAPLGRAVIGGLSCATIATLIFVPTVFALIHERGKKNEANSNSQQLAEVHA
ncbi:cation/multidrug efflux pump [Terriglobus roseus DSM 18391]|uniref:Cation/multidrug efflux pump n=1 Tax=Terriglobus roseus (strain DSM 18391 / NRRL B-41598 / KBS 63) TaxID=926566 RepID=I3ZED6_TERRK|nr:efflux RND transporter permease subunit [Terriglobus roseus]AFL87604.1 cation/multidrug efflux pump [Terriglobus roseus DSM 18391]